MYLGLPVVLACILPNGGGEGGHSLLLIAIESLGLPITPTASTNLNVTNNIWCKKPKESPPCFAHKLRPSSGAKDWWIRNRIFNIRNGAPNSRRQVYRLRSKEAIHIYLKAGIRLGSGYIPSVNPVSTRWWSDRQFVGRYL